MPTAAFLTVGLLINGIFDAKPRLELLRAGARLRLAIVLTGLRRLIVFRVDDLRLRFGADLPLARAMAPSLLSFALCFADRLLLAIIHLSQSQSHFPFVRS